MFNRPVATVDYVWTPGTTLNDYCEGSTVGCADGSIAFSVLRLDEHELFHAARDGRAQRGLEEGLAVAFGDDRVLAGHVDNSDIETVLRDTGPYLLPDGVHYPRLGHFVSYLPAFYGDEALVQLADATSIDDDYEGLAASVEAVVGISMDQMIADYEAEYPICDSTHFRYDGFDCGRNPIEFPANDGDEVDLSVRVGCDEPTTLGPRSGEIWTMLSLNVPADGRYSFDIYSENPEADPRIRLRQCDAACDEVDASLPQDAGAWLGLTACLSAGNYTLRLSAAEGTAASFRIQSERFDSTSCE
ncbi:MAG: hypothetical protein AAF799_17320 [Myxococcota bacterium]